MIDKHSYFDCEFATINVDVPSTDYSTYTVGGSYKKTTFLLYAYTGNTYPTALDDSALFDSLSYDKFAWVDTQDTFEAFNSIYSLDVSSLLEFEFRTGVDNSYLVFKRKPQVFVQQYIAVQNSFDTMSVEEMFDTELNLMLIDITDGSFKNTDQVRACNPSYVPTVPPTLETASPTPFPTSQPTAPTSPGGIGIVDLTNQPTSSPTDESLDLGLIFGLGLGLPIGLVAIYFGIRYYTRSTNTFSQSQYRTIRVKQHNSPESIRLIFGNKV